MIPIYLISQLGFIVILSVFSGYLNTYFYDKKKLCKVTQGILFGIIAIANDLINIVNINGLLISPDSIILSLCSYFFGLISGVIALLLIMFNRFLLQLNFELINLSGALFGLIMGYIFYKIKISRKDSKENFKDIFLLTYSTHLLLFFAFYFYYKGVFIQNNKLFLTYFLLIYPFISFVMWKILYDQKISITSKQELQRNYQLLENVFNNPFSLIAVLDKDFNFIRVNKAFAEADDKDVSFFVGKNHFDLYPSDAKAIFEEVVKNRKPYQVYARPFIYANAPEKGITYWDWTLVPVLDQFGRIDYLIFTLRNVTEKVKLEETKSRLISIIENSDDFIAIFNKYHNIIYLNDAGKKMLGITDLSEIPIKHHTEWSEKLINDVAITEAIKNGKWKGEAALLTKSNKEIPVSQVIIAHKDKQGDVLYFSTIARDISQIKIYEEELKRSELKYKLMVENLTNAIVIHKKGKFYYVNDAGLKLIEAESFEQIKDIPIIEFVHPDYRDIVMNRISNVFKGEKAELLEEKFITLKGNVKDVLVSAAPITIEGEPASMAIITDITDLKRESLINQLLSEISIKMICSEDLLDFVSFLRDRLNDLMDAKNFFLALYNSNEDTLTSPFDWDKDANAPETWSAEGSITGLVVKEKKCLLLKKSELEELIKSGKIKLIGTLPEVWLGVPLVYEEKALGAIVIQSYDNPEAYNERTKKLLETIANYIAIYIRRKLEEEDLRLMKKAVDESQISIIITDKNGIIQYVNKKFEEMTGYTSDEAIGKTPRILKSGFHSQEFYENLWDALLKGNNFEAEFFNKKKNGEFYWEIKSILPLLNKNGELTHIVSFGIDITEKKKMMEDLILAKERAEEANRIKSHFLSAMSHEIRTPLNAILGFNSLISEYFEQYSIEETNKWFEALRNNAKRLIETVSTILDYEKIEAGEYKSIIAEINLNKLVTETVESLRSLAIQKNLPLNIQLPEKDIIIYSDKFALQSILINLVNNAIKFTKEGYVNVKVERLFNKIKLSVKDTGIGMSEEYQKFLFESFSQEMVGYKREYEGTGLGLALTKKYIDILDGEIKVFSKKGEGSLFEVYLPIKEK